MQGINKFSQLKSEELRIVESIKKDYGQMAIDIAKKMGFNSLEEVAKQKQVLTKLESLLKDLPSKSDVSEDRAEEIEDDIKKKGEPKSEEDEEGKKEPNSKTGAGNEVAESEEEEEKEEEGSEEEEEGSEEEEEGSEEEEEVEEEINSKNNPNPAGYPPPGGNSDDVKSHRIKSFEDFIKESEETVNKKVSYTDDAEEEEDYADPIAESFVPSYSRFLAESKEDAFIEVDMETGDGDKTAEEIEDEINKLGKPKTAKEDKSLIAEGDFTFTDAIQTTGDNVKQNERGIKSALSALGAKSGSELILFVDTTEDEDLRDATSKMKPLKIDSTVYDKAFVGKYKGKDVVVFNDGEDDFAYIKEDKSQEIEDKINDLGKPETAEEDDELIGEKKILEKDITSDDDFKSYAMTVLKNAFGDEFDETKADEVISGLIDKYSGDYGAMIGALQSSLD